MEWGKAIKWELQVDTKLRITPLRGMCWVNTYDSLVSLYQGGNNRVLPLVGQVCSRLMTLYDKGIG